MDYETAKEQWGEVEDRDGVRLSWNTFPSSRMVGFIECLTSCQLTPFTGSFKARCSDRRTLHPLEGEARYSSPPL